MPLAEEPLALLAAALRDPKVVLRYQAKMMTVPGSDCLLVARRGVRSRSRTQPRRAAIAAFVSFAAAANTIRARSTPRCSDRARAIRACRTCRSPRVNLIGTAAVEPAGPQRLVVG